MAKLGENWTKTPQRAIFANANARGESAGGFTFAGAVTATLDVMGGNINNQRDYTRIMAMRRQFEVGPAASEPTKVARADINSPASPSTTTPTRRRPEGPAPA